MPTIRPAFKYQIGGSLSIQAPCYVERHADLDLAQGLRAGLFCYVLNSRQMGKSSLRVQTMHRLHQQNVACGAIDMTAIGSQEITVDQWYASIISNLVSSFRLNMNLREWWHENLYLSPIQRLNKFVEDILLVETSQNIVIFIDEIDSVLSLPFAVDDFFAWIRACYNKRTEQPAYQRLTFALLGVATPSDLIRDKSRTPFNIGKAITLRGFDALEAQPLLGGLQNCFVDPERVLAEVLAWTGGQPFLTQKICQILGEESSDGVEESGTLEAWVAQKIHQRVIQNWVAQDEPEHFKTIRDRLFLNEKQLNRLLGIYGQILAHTEIPFTEEPEQMELLLSGLVMRQRSATNSAIVLQIANPIYAAIFNGDWLDREIAKLRPYSDNIRKWLAADRDESWLLRGTVLAEALVWAQDQKLSDQDYQFLNASQALENKAAQILNAQRLSKILRGFLVAAVVAIVLLSGVTGWALTNARKTTISEIAALNSFSTSFYNSNPQPLDALLPAVQAGSKLAAMVNAPADLKAQVQSSIQKSLGAVKEHNRLQGHRAPVMGASFSPDGQTLASASWDGTIKLWSRAGRELKTLEGHSAELWNVVFSPDGQFLASASSDRTVKLWRIDGTLLHTLTGHRGVVGEVVFSPDGQSLASTGADGEIRLWSVDGKLLQAWQADEGWVWGLAFSPDGQRIVSGGSDHLIKIWSLEGKKLGAIAGHQDTVTEVIYSHDGKQLASASNDGSVRRWNLAGQLLQTFQVPGAQIWDLHFSPDGQSLAAVSSDNTVRLWSLADRDPMVLKTSAQIARINYSPDGQYLAMASWDRTIKLWQVADPTGSPLENRWSESQIIPAHSAQINSLSFSHRGDRIATSSWDRSVKLWDSAGKLINTLEPQGEIKNYAVWDTIFSPDDQVLASVIWDGRVVLWNHLGQEIGVIPGEGRLKTSFSPNGQSIAVGAPNNSFKLWSLTGEELQAFPGHKAPVTAVDISADGLCLVSASADGTLKLWNRSGILLQTFYGHQSEVNRVRFNADRSLIASGGADGTIRLWTLNGQEIRQIAAQQGEVADFDFSPNGQFLASGGSDRTVKLWSIAAKTVSQQAIATLDKHRGAVTTVAFSPDGQRLASGGFDNNLILVDLNHFVTTSLESSLTQACDWLGDYLDRNSEAGLAERLRRGGFCHAPQSSTTTS
jgi:WD40 repeat protein